MPMFTYSAIDPETRKVIEGKIEAESLRRAKEQIRNQGQIPTTLEEFKEEWTLARVVDAIPLLSALTNPSLKDLFIFTQQLYTLLDAGIPLIEGLYLLENQTTNKVLSDTVRQVRTDVVTGDSFSASVARHSTIFNNLYVSLIKAGETSGQLSGITERLSGLIDNQIRIKAKISGAMMMPGITLGIIVLVTVGMLVFLVPKFEGIFMKGGKELPLPTQLLLMSSDLMTDYWWLMLGFLVGFAVWFNIFRKSDAGKPLVDQWLLSIPVISNLLIKSYTSTFIKTLATLQASGVSLTDSIVIAASTVENYVMHHTLKQARESILAGGSLAKPLEESKVFPAMVVKMIAVGEETGSLDMMMQKSSVLLDREVDEAVSKLTELIQPVLTIIIGCILTFILLGLYLPVFDMSSTM